MRSVWEDETSPTEKRRSHSELSGKRGDCEDEALVVGGDGSCFHKREVFLI